jgi:hypothetical protein
MFVLMFRLLTVCATTITQPVGGVNNFFQKFFWGAKGRGGGAQVVEDERDQPNPMDPVDRAGEFL